jgi:pimeloyl-ACP methyl ester carboxylesterase
LKKEGKPHFRRIIDLIAVGGLCTGIFWWTPMSSDFFRYLIWRMISTASTLKGHVRVGDVDIHYVSYGSGPTVLLLHGGLSNRLSWFSQLPWLVDSGRRVVLPDTRGHGNSGLGDGDLSYRLLATDAIKILDKLCIKKVDVVGWSDGGNTALLLGLYWPQRVRRIVAISANFNPAGLTPEAQRETFQPSSGVARWLRRWWTGAGDRFQRLEARIKRMWRIRPNLEPADLGEITAPTLVIVGESDVVSLSHARQMYEQLAHGSLAIIAGGHFTPITRARQVNGLIAGFLDIEPLDESAESSAHP